MGLRCVFSIVCFTGTACVLKNVCFGSKRTSLQHPHKAAGTTVQMQYLGGRAQTKLGSSKGLGW